VHFYISYRVFLIWVIIDERFFLRREHIGRILFVCIRVGMRVCSVIILRHPRAFVKIESVRRTTEYIITGTAWALFEI